MGRLDELLSKSKKVANKKSIKVCRYYDHLEDDSPWNVTVYFVKDPAKHRHDFDLFMTSDEWKKLSGLRSPRKNETMCVTMSFIAEDE